MPEKSRLQTKNATPKPAVSLSQSGLLQRTCACGGVPGLRGECEACASKPLSGQRGTANPAALPNRPSDEQSTAPLQRSSLGGYSFGNLAIEPKERFGIQTKLAIGQSGDKYEQEADRVASQVIQKMNAPASAQSRQGRSLLNQDDEEEKLQTKPSISSLQRSPLIPEDKEDKDKIQPKPILQGREAIAGGEASMDLESAIARARSGGQALDPGLRVQMGQAMGTNFSGVRVHTDAQSDQLNQSIQAKAFTTGQDVFFRQGEYNPGSRGGQELIAHELTHVVQQNGGMVSRTSLKQEELDMKKSPLASTQPNPTNVSYRPVVQRFPVYRSGGATLNNMTPKVKDTEGSKRGLSTFEDPLKAPIKIVKAQIIETDNLPNTLEAVRNGTSEKDTHVSIRPPNDGDRAKLLAWVNAGETSALSQSVLSAVSSTWKPEKK